MDGQSSFLLTSDSGEDYSNIKQEPEDSIDDIHVKVCTFLWHVMELYSV